MPKILYVEDNPDNFRLVKTLLEKAGYQVVGASDGIEAITRAQQEMPDLILMDINIPSLTGCEVTTRLKTIPGLMKVPVVALTAKTMKGDKDLALAAGCVGFIPKPIDPFRFVRDMESFLGGREDKIADSEEQTVLREYSRKLVSNLEEKVTQLQEFNRKLQESEERYRTLVENVNIGIWFLASDRQSLFLNQRMRDLLGMGSQNPQSPDRFMDGAAWEQFQKHLQLCAAGRPQVWEGSLLTRERLSREVVVAGVAVHDTGGEVTGYLLSVLDITEKKQLERHLEQVHKLESLSTLTAGVAHDFNNILTIIQNNADILIRKNVLSPDDGRKLQNIAGAAQMGTSLISQLLAFARETPPNLRVIDPTKLLQGFCQFFSNYKKASIQIRFPAFKSLPPILADPVQLEQVLLNLASNAQDAMPDGGLLDFDLALQSGKDAGHGSQPGQDYVCFVVRDTGSGIPPEVQQRMFEPFFTTKPPGKGTGLGLSAVFGIVKHHNGYIEVDSKPGAGTRFRIYFPVSAGEPSAASGDGRPKAAVGQQNVLVVEDEVMLGELMCEMLSEIGMSVSSAETAERARQILGEKGESLHYVLLDYNMPDMDLPAMLKLLRTRYPAVRIILSSGFKKEEIMARIGALDIDAYLKKPFNMQSLVELIGSLESSA